MAAQLSPPPPSPHALGSLLVASYDSQVYGESIRTGPKLGNMSVSHVATWVSERRSMCTTDHNCRQRILTSHYFVKGPVTGKYKYNIYCE
jgi:hypothetical protein